LIICDDCILQIVEWRTTIGVMKKNPRKPTHVKEAIRVVTGFFLFSLVNFCLDTTKNLL